MMQSASGISMAFATTLVFSNPSAVVYAQVPHDDIAKSIVYLQAKAQVRSGPNASQWVNSEGTGTLVSDDGLILTVYHLISELGDVEPRTVGVEARIADKTANAKPAAIVDALINTDVMLLKIPPDRAAPYPAVVLGSARDHNDAELIYTSGFPKTSSYIKDDGKIQNRSGPGGYLWLTSMNFIKGQSGSPVYNAEAEVIGIVKGNEGSSGYIIPIEFAEALLAQVRLREIRAAMKDFERLRRKFTWSGELDRNSRRFKITYERPVGGEPEIRHIDVRITGRGSRNNKLDRLTAFTLREIKQTGRLGPDGGIFELPSDLYQRIERYREEFEFENIEALEITILPLLTDGEPAQPKGIEIVY